MFELCLLFTHTVCIFPGAYDALFRNFSIGFASASCMITLLQCSFTCRLTNTFQANFSGGLSNNYCAVGRSYLYRTSCSATNQLLEVLSFTANCLNANSLFNLSIVLFDALSPRVTPELMPGQSVT